MGLVRGQRNQDETWILERTKRIPYREILLVWNTGLNDSEFKNDQITDPSVTASMLNVDYR